MEVEQLSESNEGVYEDWLDLRNDVRTNKAQIQKSLYSEDYNEGPVAYKF